MFNKRKEEQLEELSPAALEEQKKQRSNNRIFALVTFIALILFAMLIVEIVTKAS